MKTIEKIVIIPLRQIQVFQENAFNRTPITRINVAMRTNSADAGSSHEKTFNYQLFHLRSWNYWG